MAESNIEWAAGDLGDDGVFFTRSEFEEYSNQYKLCSTLLEKQHELHPGGATTTTTTTTTTGSEQVQDPGEDRMETAQSKSVSADVTTIETSTQRAEQAKERTLPTMQPVLPAAAAQHLWRDADTKTPPVKAEGDVQQSSVVPEPKPYNPSEALSQTESAKVVKALPGRKAAKRNAVWMEAETTEPEEKVHIYDKAKQAGGFTMHYHKFPRLSWLTMAEHKLYLELQKKYITPALGALQSKPPSELKQFQKFKELYQKVTQEQEEFLVFSEAEAARNPHVYSHIHNTAVMYIDEHIACLCERVVSYPPFYVQQDSVSLVEQHAAFAPLVHVKCLLKLGYVPRVIIPQGTPLNRLTLDYNHVTKAFPTKTSYASKPTCSHDENTERLATKYAAEMVTSISALKCLLDLGTNLERQWELPVVVKEHVIDDIRGRRTQKVVYVDKPFPPRAMLTSQKCAWYYKFAMKCLFQQPDHPSCQVFSSQNKNNANPIKEDVDDAICDLDNLETFGISASRPSAFKKYIRPKTVPQNPETEIIVNPPGKESSDERGNVKVKTEDSAVVVNEETKKDAESEDANNTKGVVFLRSSSQGFIPTVVTENLSGAAVKSEFSSQDEQLGSPEQSIGSEQVNGKGPQNATALDANPEALVRLNTSADETATCDTLSAAKRGMSVEVALKAGSDKNDVTLKMKSGTIKSEDNFNTVVEGCESDTVKVDEKPKVGAVAQTATASTTTVLFPPSVALSLTLASTTSVDSRSAPVLEEKMDQVMQATAGDEQEMMTAEVMVDSAKALPADTATDDSDLDALVIDSPESFTKPTTTQKDVANSMRGDGDSSADAGVKPAVTRGRFRRGKSNGGVINKPSDTMTNTRLAAKKEAEDGGEIDDDVATDVGRVTRGKARARKLHTEPEQCMPAKRGCLRLRPDCANQASESVLATARTPTRQAVKQEDRHSVSDSTIGGTPDVKIEAATAIAEDDSEESNQMKRRIGRPRKSKTTQAEPAEQPAKRVTRAGVVAETRPPLRKRTKTAIAEENLESGDPIQELKSSKEASKGSKDAPAATQYAKTLNSSASKVHNLIISDIASGNGNIADTPLSPPPQTPRTMAAGIHRLSLAGQAKVVNIPLSPLVLQPKTPSGFGGALLPCHETKMTGLNLALPAWGLAKMTETPLSLLPLCPAASHLGDNIADSPLSPAPLTLTRDSEKHKTHFSLMVDENVRIIPLSPCRRAEEISEQDTDVVDGVEEHVRQEEAGKEAVAQLSTKAGDKKYTSSLSTLDQILKAQETFLKSPAIMVEDVDNGSATCIEPPIPASTKEVKDPLEWEPAEDPADYKTHAQKNLTYNLWMLGNVRLIIRCGVHGVTKHKKSRQMVSLACKMEYQPVLGVAQVTSGEEVRNWVDVHLRHVNRLITARVNAMNSQVMMVDQLKPENIVNAKSIFNPLTAASRLHCVLEKLKSLPVGHYLLGHSPGNTHAHIKKSVTSTSGVYDLHKAYLGSMVGVVNDDRLPWIPIDPTIQLHQHQKNHWIPATFIPKDSSEASNYTRGGKQQWKGKKGGKKKDKKKGGQKKPAKK